MTRFELLKFADTPEQMASYIEIMMNCGTCLNEVFENNIEDEKDYDCRSDGDCHKCMVNFLNNPVILRKYCGSCEFDARCHNKGVKK